MSRYIVRPYGKEINENSPSYSTKLKDAFFFAKEAAKRVKGKVFLIEDNKETEVWAFIEESCDYSPE
jgi:hypothetical protein